MTLPPLLVLAEGRKPRARKALLIQPKEIELHMTVADLLRRFVKPGWRWGHYPAGEHRDVRTAAKLKAMGVQRGWADFLLFAPAGGQLHSLELKRIGEDLTEDQEDFRTWCVENDAPHAVARTIDEALRAFDRWNCLRIKRSGGAHG